MTSRENLRSMFTLEDMTCFCRVYGVNYNIDHDITLKGGSSYWSCQLSIQPSMSGQMDLLRKLFRGEDYVADEIKGEFLLRFPIFTNEKLLRPDEIFARFASYEVEMSGATFQVQMVIAPKDEEYKEAFSRAQKWEWLVSSVCISELFLTGEFTKSGPEFAHVFHSCHQSDMNRSLTDDVPHLLNNWDMMLHCMMTASDCNKSVKECRQGELLAKADHVYTIPFEDVKEMEMVYNMCCSLEVDKNYTLKMQKDSIETDLNCLAMTDILFAVNVSRLYNLFGMDME